MRALPRIASEIERRLLVNYRADPEVVTRILPEPFRPQLAGDAAVVGICLIRLSGTRPVGFPRRLGLSSENAAHRIAVEWDSPQGKRFGVFIAQRHSGARLTVALGGRMFPGAHRKALFRVRETQDQLDIAFATTDDQISVDISVRLTDSLQSGIFTDLDSASRFFERGADGFSATIDQKGYEGLRLQSEAWKIDPATVLHARSTFYEDHNLFPPGSIEIDHALIMRNIPARWLALDTIAGCRSATGSPLNVAT
jgi:hypothetical protein